MLGQTDPRQALNRIFWMVFFFAGFVLFGWLEWQSVDPSAMAWFLVTSIWSAVSAIGFTVGNWWILRGEDARIGEPRDEPRE